MEPEDDPEDVIRRMERPIAEYSETGRETAPLPGDVDPIGEDFRETVRKGASETTDE